MAKQYDPLGYGISIRRTPFKSLPSLLSFPLKNNSIIPFQLIFPDNAKMNREKLLATLCLLLAGTTVTALVKINRLHLANQVLQTQLSPPAEAPAASPAPALPALEPAPAAPAVSPAVVSDTVAALETQLATLRQQLAERDQRLAASWNSGNTNRSFRGDRRMREAELAALKESDPAKYQEIQQQRADFRDRVKTAASDQVSFLESVDVSRWSAEQQENHAKLLATIASFTEAMTRETAPAEGGEESRHQLFERMHEAGQLMETEQSLLLYDTAQQLGFDDKGSREFVDYIETIHKATSPRGFFPGGPGRGGPRSGTTTASQPPQ